MKARFAILSLALVTLAGCATPPPETFPPAGPRSVPIPAAPPRGEPERFANISAPQLQVLLGAPAFVRKDGATEMWRYDAANCRAFFFLYGNAGAQVVRHIETLPAGKTQAADPVCLNALRKTS